MRHLGPVELAFVLTAAAIGCGGEETTAPPPTTVTSANLPPPASSAEPQANPAQQPGALQQPSAAAEPSIPAINPPEPSGRTVPLPPGTSLIRAFSVTQIRAFPDEAKVAAGQGGQGEEATVAIAARALDRDYASNMPYQDVVGYLDRSLQGGGYTVSHRMTTADATFWAVRLPDGTPARVAARMGTPTTIEVVTLAGAAVVSSPGREPQTP